MSLDQNLRDANTLRRAAEVLETRTKKPDGVILRAILKALRDTAYDIEFGKAPVRR